MPARTPLLAFIGGAIFLSLGIFLLVAPDYTEATSLERWEDGHNVNDQTWHGRRERKLGRHLHEDGPPQAGLYAGLVFALVGVGLMLPQLLQWGAESAFKEAVLEPPAEGAELGGEAVVRVRLVPGKALRVASAELRLISKELAFYIEGETVGPLPSGDQQTGYASRVMEVHRWSTRLEVPQDLTAPFEVEVPIPIPRDAPPTFRWERHQTFTRLELEVVLIGRMNLNLEKPLIILPRLAPGAAA